ncbi:MAG: hypothetical protein ACWGOX_15175 [Desulforhopalus sp.]
MRFLVFALITIASWSWFSQSCHCAPEAAEQSPVAQKPGVVKNRETAAMLSSLLDLQKSLKEQISISRKKLQDSTSEAEKASLQQELSTLDKQLSGTFTDFERIATGVEPALFSEKKPETFSWKDELSSLLEPAIKELKRLTVRARQKTRLKDSIAELNLLSATSSEAVVHLQKVLDETQDPRVRSEVEALLPEWLNIEKRLGNKLELAERELAQLQEQETSLLEFTSNSVKTFFRERGLYMIVAAITFGAVLLVCQILHRFISRIVFRLNNATHRRSFQARLFDILFRIVSILLAIIGSFFILYLAEDWFLLSLAIIFFLGLAWTIRQTLPRLWQQGRLMLNIGSVRENERLILHGVPWKVVSINVFCKLVNPALEVELRLPIENLIGMVSRPYKREEPWFPCKKGDWVVIGNDPRARVVSLSHEQVELVERGGKRIVYATEVFLQASPVNLSRNFRIRVPFGISYSLQEQATSSIPVTLNKFITQRLEEEAFGRHCLNLQVEFCLANSSSLDILIIADFDGSVADICKRIERAIQKWCVECCTAQNWEIPFPQLTVHMPGKKTTTP